MIPKSLLGAFTAVTVISSPAFAQTNPPPLDQDAGWSLTDGEGNDTGLDMYFEVSGFLEYTYEVTKGDDVVETGRIYQIIGNVWGYESSANGGGGLLEWSPDGYFKVHNGPQFPDRRIVPN